MSSSGTLKKKKKKRRKKILWRQNRRKKPQIEWQLLELIIRSLSLVRYRKESERKGAKRRVESLGQRVEGEGRGGGKRGSGGGRAVTVKILY